MSAMDEREKLRKALRKYGVHQGRCEAFPGECTCGLEAALDDAPEREVWGYAYRYPDGIRVETHGREINGSKPSEVMPLYLGEPLAGTSYRAGDAPKPSGGALRELLEEAMTYLDCHSHVVCPKCKENFRVFANGVTEPTLNKLRQKVRAALAGEVKS